MQLTTLSEKEEAWSSKPVLSLKECAERRDPCFAFPSSAFPFPPSLPPFCLETDFHMAQTILLFATQQKVTLNSVFLPTPPPAEIIGVHRHSRL